MSAGSREQLFIRYKEKFGLQEYLIEEDENNAKTLLLALNEQPEPAYEGDQHDESEESMSSSDVYGNDYWGGGREENAHESNEEKDSQEGNSKNPMEDF